MKKKNKNRDNGKERNGASIKKEDTIIFIGNEKENKKGYNGKERKIRNNKVYNGL